MPKSMPGQEYLRRMVEKQATRNPLLYKATTVTLKFLMHFSRLNAVMLIVPEESILEGEISDTEWEKKMIS